MNKQDSSHPSHQTMRVQSVSRRDFLGLAAGGSLALATGQLWAQPAWKAAPAASGKKIRLGVVGGGFGASFQFHLHPNCEVTGVTDLRPDRRTRLQQTYGCDTVYDSLEEMIEKARDIDAVAVFTGPPDHARHTIMCMERGWHVFCAVPVCHTLEEADQLKETKERTGLQYMMGETSYYRQGTIYVRELEKQKKLGELFYSELDYYHDRHDLEKLATDKTSRFFHPDGTPSWRWGMPPILYPTHSLGFLVGVTRERITRVSCLGWGSKHPWTESNRYDNPFWNQSALMQTDRGHMARCNVFWLVSASGERATWFGSDGNFHLATHGLHKDVQVNRHPRSYEEVDVPAYWRTAEMLPEPMRVPSGHGGSHTFLSAEFINALLEEREPAVDLYESLAMTVPGIVANESSRKDGEQLKVPNFDPS